VKRNWAPAGFCSAFSVDGQFLRGDRPPEFQAIVISAGGHQVEFHRDLFDRASIRWILNFENASGQKRFQAVRRCF